jgi:hypothetical protein
MAGGAELMVHLLPGGHVTGRELSFIHGWLISSLSGKHYHEQSAPEKCVAHDHTSFAGRICGACFVQCALNIILFPALEVKATKFVSMTGTRRIWHGTVSCTVFSVIL